MQYFGLVTIKNSLVTDKKRRLHLPSKLSMSTVRIKIQDPFSRDYVVMDMPRDMKLADMQSVSDIAARTAIELSGSKEIPSCYAKFPINNVGRVALVLIAQTMPGRLADAVEGEMLMGMISATRFLRQLLDRVGTNVMMSKKLYAQSVIEFCVKSNPFFIDALRMRLPTLVQQARDTVPVDVNRAKRLSKLADIAIRTLDDLPALMGKIVYTKWISGKEPSILPEPVVEAQRDEPPSPETPSADEKSPDLTPPQPELKEKYGAADSDDTAPAASAAVVGSTVAAATAKKEEKEVKDDESTSEEEEEEVKPKPKPKRTRRTPVSRRISSPKAKPAASKASKVVDKASEKEEEDEEEDPTGSSASESSESESESDSSEATESDYGTASTSEDEDEDEDDDEEEDEKDQ